MKADWHSSLDNKIGFKELCNAKLTIEAAERKNKLARFTLTVIANPMVASVPTGVTGSTRVKIFSSANTFDEWFHISSENDQQEVVQQLHKVLRPVLLLRLKSNVEKGSPPKKETILKVGMSQFQKQYYSALLQKDLGVVNAGGEHKRLLNIAM